MVRVLPMMSLLVVLCGSRCAFGDPTDLEVSEPRTELRVGETVQLSVIQELADGSTRDLTSPATGAIYYTTSESMLIPEPDGRVTCIGTNDRDRESAEALPGGSRQDLTDASSGTRYLGFAGNAVADSSVISVSSIGLASVTTSIGSYAYRTVIVFVRNDDGVGWVVLKVVHAGAA